MKCTESLKENRIRAYFNAEISDENIFVSITYLTFDVRSQNV